MVRAWYYLVCLTAMFMVVACESQKPAYVLSAGEMEDVLYDVHRAHFTFESGNDTRRDGAHQYALFHNVLTKHDVSQAEWDSSIVYYCRHTNELEKIYQNLNDRLTYEASSIGASVSETTDTTDIWHDEKNILLTSLPPFTTKQWSINTDTLLKAGERLSLKFTALYVRESERKNAVCVLALRLRNDSVITTMQTVNRTGIYNLTVSDGDGIGIKEVKGIFMMQKDYGYGSMSSSRNTEQVLSVREIRLVHELPDNMRNRKPKSTTENADTVDTTNPSDGDKPVSAPPSSDELLPPPHGGKLQIRRSADAINNHY